MGTGLSRLCINVLLLFSILLAACSEPPREPIRIGSSPWPGYEPLYLARDLGYLDNNKVSLFELPSADITMESFRNRSVDMATLTLDEVYELLHSNIKLRILTVLDVSHGGDAVVAHPDIKNMSDIKGKRISIVNIPLGLYMLHRFLEHAGVDRKDVTVLPMSEAKQVKLYKDGQVDVIVSFEPVISQLQQAGAKKIFDSSMIPNEIFDLLVVHEDVYLARRDEICQISQGWFDALGYIKNKRSEAARKITRRLRMEEKDFDNLMSGIVLPTAEENRKLLSGDVPGLVKPANNLAEILVKANLLSARPDINEAIDKSYAACLK